MFSYRYVTSGCFGRSLNTHENGSIMMYVFDFIITKMNPTYIITYTKIKDGVRTVRTHETNTYLGVALEWTSLAVQLMKNAEESPRILTMKMFRGKFIAEVPLDYDEFKFLFDVCKTFTVETLDGTEIHTVVGEKVKLPPLNDGGPAQ